MVGESFHLLVPCLCRREPSADLQGYVVDPPGDLVELVLGQVVQARALGQVTADHAVAVLVAAPLVRAVRVRVIGQHARRLVDQQLELGLAAAVPLAASPGRGRQRAIVWAAGLRSGLQARGTVRSVRLVLVGRVPQVAPQLAADGGRAAPDHCRDLADRPVPAETEPVDHDPLACRQVAVG